MAPLPFKPRMVQIVTDESIGTSGEVVTADLPADFTVTELILTQMLVQDTDEATLAEKLASLDTFELTTRSGSPWKIDGDDLYYLNRDLYGRHPHIAGNSVATNNLIVYASLKVPLNPKTVANKWDMSMGITPASKGKIRVTMGTDTASGCDGRTLTVTALGYENLHVPEYMGAFTDNFTSVVGDNFRDIQTDRVAGLMGAYAFGTTGIEDLTTTDAPTVYDMGWAVGKSVREKIRAHGLSFDGAWNEVISPGEAAGLPVSDYHLLDMGVRAGLYVPYVNDLQVYINSKVANAVRLHPLLAMRNE